MTVFRRFGLWLRDVFRRRSFERELDEELRTFVSLSAQRRLTDGDSGVSSRRGALLEAGGIEQVKERVRDVRGGSRLEAVFRDLRHALRLMRRQPGFSAIVIVTLALGIGANAAIFSVVKSVLLSPLPFADADRLVRVQVARDNGNGAATSLSPFYFQAVRERASVFESVAAQRFQNLTLTGDGEPERVIGVGVSDQWLETLGVTPAVGRGFSDAEQALGDGSDVVLLSHAFWLRRFGGDRSVTGRAVRLNGRVYSVIGVMPAAFRYPYNADLWFPMTFSPSTSSAGDLNVPARIRAGATLAQVRAEIASMSPQIASGVPGFDDVELVVRPFNDEFGRDPNRSIAALLAAVGFVLLIACVNVANLLLARSGSRAGEIAVRSAMGAGRARQIRQLLTESVVLAALGGALGIGLAFGASQWLAVLIPARLGEVISTVQLDVSVLLACAVLCLVTGVLFGLPPAIGLTRRGAVDVLRERGTAHRRAGRLLEVLVVVEVALATLLLGGAGLMVRNFAALTTADVGYDADDLLHLNIGLSEARYEDPDYRVAAIARFVEQVEAVPGVEAAAITTLQPVPRTRTNAGTYLRPDLLDPAGPAPIVNERMVTPGYFGTLGMQLVAGRGFNSGDEAGSAPVVIVSNVAARRFWSDGNAVGGIVRHGPIGDADSLVHEVVGVVNDVAEPIGELDATVYRLYSQSTHTQPAGSWATTRVTLLVRTASNPATLAGPIRDAIHEVDPSVPLFEIAPMKQVLADPLADARLGTLVLAGFGGFGLFMAVLGTYGVLAFSVARRVPEFGVRLALGARPAELLGLVIRRGLGLVAMGLAIGAAATLALGRPLRRVITEVNPSDPLTLIAVAGTLLVAGGIACWIPARRATRVDPVRALRAD